MNNDFEHIDELIARHLAGEATAEEELLLEQWKTISPENQKYIVDVTLLFQHAAEEPKLISVNVDKAWDKVSSKVGFNSEKEEPEVQTIKLTNRFWLQIAASIILLIGLSSLVYFLAVQKNLPSAPEFVYVTKDSVNTVKLVDKTEVTLNKKSKIVYAYNRKSKQKEIQLEGEAYFEIKTKNDTQLIVRAEETFIRDIGTSFNVKAYEKENIIEVFVELGEVAFYSEKDPGITLKKGESGIYDKVEHTFSKKEIADPNIISFKTRIFVFENTTLGEVIGQLNEIYDQKIVLDSPELAECRITVSFENETIGRIVDIISETLDLQVSQISKGYVLQGENCRQE